MGTNRAVIVSITWASEYVTALKRWQPPQVGEKKSSNTSFWSRPACWQAVSKLSIHWIVVMCWSSPLPGPGQPSVSRGWHATAHYDRHAGMHLRHQRVVQANTAIEATLPQPFSSPAAPIMNQLPLVGLQYCSHLLLLFLLAIHQDAYGGTSGPQGGVRLLMQISVVSQ
jgi:hypothetical protein